MMRRLFKGCLSVLLCLLTAVNVLSLRPSAGETESSEKNNANQLTAGAVFEMGLYPQSQVTDPAVIGALDSVPCTMKSFGYVKKVKSNAQTFETVDMTYADIALNDKAYRKVTISEYRPKYGSQDGTAENSAQPDNGFTLGTYYFLWEPIWWQVMANGSDGVYVISRLILDAPYYNKFSIATTWETSGLRAWLNGDFYSSAFSEAEQAKINTCSHPNDASPFDSSITGGSDTADAVWVLSVSEAKKAEFGFSPSNDADVARVSIGTAYAKCQGLYASTVEQYLGNSAWWLRNPGEHAYEACAVRTDGSLPGSNSAYLSQAGVRPALLLNSGAEIGGSDTGICRIVGHDFVAGTVVDPTCTEGGYTVYTCSRCQATENRDVTAPTGIHTYGDPTWHWSDDCFTASTDFTCIHCSHEESVDADVAYEVIDRSVAFTASAPFNGTTYYGRKSIALPDDPIVILRQPVSASAEPGAVAAVSVTAAGEGLTYQWYLKNKGSSKWSKSSIRSDTYAVAMTKARDGRELKCVITDQYGNKVTSETAFIRYRYPEGYTPPAITAQPVSASAEPGAIAAVSVTAEGDGLTYQWYIKNKGSSSWSKSSIRSDTYAVAMTKARDGRELKCVITDRFGSSVTSEVVTIRYRYPEGYTPPVITVQPTDASAEPGAIAFVSVTAEGDGLTYQWYIKNKGSSTWSKSSITSDTYAVTMTKARDSRELRCVITDRYGNSVTSATAFIRIG